MKEASRLLHSSILTVEKDRIDLEEDELPADDIDVAEMDMLNAETQAMEVEASQQVAQADRLRRMDYDEFERAREFLASEVRRQQEGKQICPLPCFSPSTRTSMIVAIVCLGRVSFAEMGVNQSLIFFFSSNARVFGWEITHWG